MPLSHKDTEALCKKWVHSAEEDTPTHKVYRPADHPFPPARGREALVFHDDGRCTVVGIGPTDVSALTPALWSDRGEEEAVRVRIENEEGGPIAEATLEGDHLLVRRATDS